MRSALGKQTSLRRAHAAAALLCAVAGLGAAAWLRPTLESARDYTPAFTLNDKSQEAANSTPFAMIMGEVRTSMADLMWVKTERYLHNGVAFGAHLDMDALSASGEVKDAAPHAANGPGATIHAHNAAAATLGPPAPGEHAEHDDDDHDGDHHEHATTLIPTARADFRGFVGTLQREIQPWQDPSKPHNHAGGSELLPWYRVLTIANPNHVRGYMIGAWWLTKQGSPGEREAGIKEAESFASEGIQNNPDAFALHIMRARILIAQNRFKEAITDFQAARDSALKVRTATGAEQAGIWSDSDEEDFATALRMIPMLQLRKLNQPDAARLSVPQGLKYLPRDNSLNEFRRELGL